jgi:hypothetical protein
VGQNSISFSVFTKPWKLPLPEPAKMVAGWGFGGIELPVRPGFQVLPENLERDLPRAVRVSGFQEEPHAPPG